MKFDELKKDELLDLAAKYGVDVKTTMNKETISSELRDNGVTEEFVEENLKLVEQEKALEPGPVEVEEDDDSPRVLLRMTRKNPTFEAFGYLFTQRHPFAPVKEEDADKIMDRWEGFRPATPREVADFYG